MSDRRQPCNISAYDTLRDHLQMLCNLLRSDLIKYYLLLLFLCSFIQLSVLRLYSFFRPTKRSINAPSLKLGLSPCCRMSALPDWSESTRTVHVDIKAGFSLVDLFTWRHVKPIRLLLFLPSKDHGRHVRHWVSVKSTLGEPVKERK